MKVSALVKGCNPIITVIQLDVRLTLQFFGLKKHCHRIITKPARNVLRANMLTGSNSKELKTWCYLRTASSFLALNYPTRPLILNLMLKL